MYTAMHVYMSPISILRFLVVAALILPAASAQVNLPVGTRLSVRLRDRISSRHSQPGDAVSAMLIAPVLISGKEVIPAGLLVQGTVVNPNPAHKRLNHSVLCLRFGKLVGEANRSAAFQARVLSVDNGRESVDGQGVIHGLRPLRRRPTEVEDLLMLAASAHPAVLAS